MTDRPETPLLDQVVWPADLRKLQPEQLRQLADELRAETIAAVASPVAIWGRAWAWWS